MSTGMSKERRMDKPKRLADNCDLGCCEESHTHANSMWDRFNAYHESELASLEKERLLMVGCFEKSNDAVKKLEQRNAEAPKKSALQIATALGVEDFTTVKLIETIIAQALITEEKDTNSTDSND